MSQAKTEVCQTESKSVEEDEVKLLLREIKSNMVTKEGLNETLDARIKGLVTILATKEEVNKLSAKVKTVEAQLTTVEAESKKAITLSNEAKFDLAYDKEKGKDVQAKVNAKLLEIDETHKQDRLMAVNEYISLHSALSSRQEEIIVQAERIQELEKTVQELKISIKEKPESPKINDAVQQLNHWPDLTVIVDGLNENTGSADRDHVIRIGKSIGVPLTYADLAVVNRLGTRRGARPLEIVFTSQEKRDLFYKNRL